MLRASLMIFACVTCFLPVALAQETELIPWARDFREAADLAARERKLVLLHFWADDCPPCRVVEAKVFTNEAVATAVSVAFVPVKIHVEKSPEMARRYQVARWPTDVIVNPAGLEVYRTVSPQDPQKYVSMLTDVATRSGTMLARNLPSAVDPVRNMVSAAANGAAGGPYQARPPVDPATGAPALPNAAAPPQQAANNAPPADPYANRVVNNQYATGPKTSGAALAGGGDYGSDYAPPSGPADTAPANNAASDYLPPPPNFDNAPTQSPASEPARDIASPPLAKTEAPANLPPLGMEGYCVVTLTEGTVWKKGDRRFGAIHRGKLYLFAGPEEQKKFLADPDRFSPALSGFDPVQFTEAGKLIDGKRAFGLSFNNQMYLFTDEASRGKFESDPRRYAETVYQAMLRNNNANTKLR